MLFDVRGVIIEYEDSKDAVENAIIDRTFNLALKEPSILDFIDNMPHKSVFYDLGACIGSFSLYANKLGHTVYSIEPDPINFGRFKAAVEKYNSNINLFNVAINDGSKNTETLLVEGKINHSHHRILKTNNFSGAVYLEDKIVSSDNTYELPVAAMSMDDFVKNKANDFPTHIKIDIDGSEVLFIEGCENTLSDQRVKEVIFELDKASSKHQFIVDRMSSFGLYIKEEYFIPHGGDSLFNILFWRG